MTRHALNAVAGALLLATAPVVGATEPPAVPVRIERVPDDGIQARVARGEDASVHMVYYKGEPAAGDIYYVHRGADASAFSDPIRVNSQPGSAVAAGTNRGPQIALGRGGRVHVAWNGSIQALPKGPPNPALPKDSPHNGTPMLYARLNDAGDAFEPQRNLMQHTFGLDGGGAIAADTNGRVYVAWHAASGDRAVDEAHQRVWVARSDDDGRTFAAERAALDSSLGACGCCGMAALVDPRGSLFLLYRSATGNVQRDMYLLASTDAGAAFQTRRVDQWRRMACPASSSWIARGGSGLLLAWETRGQVSYARVDPKTRSPLPAIAAPGGDGVDRKHPVVAGDSQGRVVLVWIEGAAWGGDGVLGWQVFDADDRPIPGASGRRDGVPAWDLPAVVADRAGGFTIYR